MELKTIIDAIRQFPGVTRKGKIHEVTDMFPLKGFPQVFAAEGEDAAAIDMGDRYVLFAADGIMESLVKSDPYLAGYFSVLVNVNDIAAMGGRASGMVDILSMSDAHSCDELLKGIQEGIRRFNVPLVGGHTHPDCHYNAIDISIIGHVPKDSIVLSSTARPGDDIVFVMDVDGYYPKSVPYAWVTTLDKDIAFVQDQMEAAAVVADRKLVHAGKDMSNPGSLGTLGMMLECSEMGATVDVNKIPVPEDCEDFVKWLLAYQGCAFVYSCPPESSAEVIEIFEKVGCKGAVVGKVDDTKVFKLKYNGEEGVLFDFNKDIITGCRPKAHQ